MRVNSLGAKLRSSDLALAQITAKWRNSLTIFQAFQTQCSEAGFYLDLGLVLKNLVVFMLVALDVSLAEKLLQKSARVK